MEVRCGGKLVKVVVDVMKTGLGCVHICRDGRNINKVHRYKYTFTCMHLATNTGNTSTYMYYTGTHTHPGQ